MAKWQAPPLPGKLRARLQECGELLFPEYLQHVLYDPEEGYYASGRARIGWDGDFITNVSVGEVYGKVLAQWVMQVWEELGKPAEFLLMEQGVNDGALSGFLRAEFRQHPEFFQSLRHCLIEPVALLAERQRSRLAEEARGIEWRAELPLPQPADYGVHLSNELLDAFPFYLVEWDGTLWWELVVRLEGDQLSLAAKGPRDAALLSALAKLPTDLPAGYRTELRTNYLPWLEQVSHSLKQGRILICDYGYPREIYYLPERSRGTLFCYQRHQRDENPLASPGEKDVSAHVDFTALMEAAESAGWRVRGFTDQHHFLIRTAEPWLRSLDQTALGGSPSAAEQKLLRQLQLLLHPETLGRQFRFLDLEKPARSD